MYICLTDSFLSIVRDRTNRKNLLIRARFAEDIERTIATARVRQTPLADYPHRASVDALTVARTIADKIQSIDYDNFKDNADAAHSAVYLSIWQLLRWAQETRRT